MTMYSGADLFIAFLIALLSILFLTYHVKQLAIRWKVLDFPNYRKIHDEVTPRLGGLAIFLGAFLGALYLRPENEHLPEVLLGALVIIVTGALDDRYQIRPVIKLSGQVIAASFLISSGLFIDRITFPCIGIVDLCFVIVRVTLIWVVGITYAIYLIDGVDWLATGVTMIALTSLFLIALIDCQVSAAVLCIFLIGSNLGF